MDKAILVFDMPEHCCNCPCFVTWEVIPSIEEYTCNLKNISVDKYNKPDWCPLKPAPEKVEVFMDDWADGYNACLEDVLEQ